MTLEENSISLETKLRTCIKEKVIYFLSHVADGSYKMKTETSNWILEVISNFEKNKFNAVLGQNSDC